MAFDFGNFGIRVDGMTLILFMCVTAANLFKNTLKVL